MVVVVVVVSEPGREKAMVKSSIIKISFALYTKWCEKILKDIRLQNKYF